MHKLIPLERVCELTGLGKTSIYVHGAAGTFPKPCKMGPRCTRWVEAEVQAWVAAQIADRDSNLAAAGARQANRALQQGARA